MNILTRTTSVLLILIIFASIQIESQDSQTEVLANEIVISQAHQDNIMGLTFADDSKNMFSASLDGTVKKWQVSDGKMIEETSIKGEELLSVAINSKGNSIVVGAMSGAVYVKESKTDKPVKLNGHSEPVWSSAYSPDDKYFATASADNTAIIWDVATNKKARTLASHTNEVSSVDFSADGKYLATGSDDKSIRIWLVESGETVAEFTNLGGWITDVSFNNDGTKLAAAVAQARSVIVLDIKSEKRIHTFSDINSPVRCAKFSPDGTYVSGAGGAKTCVWNAESGELVNTITGHQKTIMAISFAPDGKYLATTGQDKSIRIVAEWQDERVSGPSKALRYANLKLVKSWQAHKNFAWGVCYSPDGKLAISTGLDGIIKVYNTSDWSEKYTIKEHDGYVFNSSFSSDGKTFATIGEDKTVRVWNTIDGSESATLRGHGDGVIALQFSADGSVLATSDKEGFIILWDIKKKTQKTKIKAHSRVASSIAFSLDGTKLFSTGKDCKINVWNSSNGKLVHCYSDNQREISSLNLSPDGKLLAAASPLGSAVVIWNTETQKPVVTLLADINCFHSVISPSGDAIAVSDSKGLKVFDVETGKKVYSQENGNALRRTAFSPDGSQVICAGMDGQVLVFTAPKKED